MPDPRSLTDGCIWLSNRFYSICYGGQVRRTPVTTARPHDRRGTRRGPIALRATRRSARIPIVRTEYDASARRADRIGQAGLIGSAERADRIGRNAARLGVPGLRVIQGGAPEALADLPQPDAIFIGGGATREGVMDACLAALRPGGRLVVHGVTLETEALLARAYNEHGGELSRLSVEQAAPVGTFTGWTPARTVTQWAFTAER